MTAIKVKLTLGEFVLWLSGLITVLISLLSALFAYMSLEELTFPYTPSSKIPSLINDLKTSLYAAFISSTYSIAVAVVLIGRSRARVVGVLLLIGLAFYLAFILIFILPEAVKYIK